MQVFVKDRNACQKMKWQYNKNYRERRGKEKTVQSRLSFHFRDDCTILDVDLHDHFQLKYAHTFRYFFSIFNSVQTLLVGYEGMLCLIRGWEYIVQLINTCLQTPETEALEGQGKMQSQ